MLYYLRYTVNIIRKIVIPIPTFDFYPRLFQFFRSVDSGYVFLEGGERSHGPIPQSVESNNCGGWTSLIMAIGACLVGVVVVLVMYIGML